VETEYREVIRTISTLLCVYSARRKIEEEELMRVEVNKSLIV
jgi:hypothetical protein